MVVAGCGSDGCDFSGDFCELATRRREPYAIGKKMLVSSMKDDDVIVAVNGYPLTKKVFDELVLIKAKQLSAMKGANPSLTYSRLEDFKKKFIPLFVAQRLLLDRARELQVLSTNEVVSIVNRTVKNAAKAKKISVQDFVRLFPVDFKYFLYDVAERAWLNALMEKHIPPVIKVDDVFVSNVQAQVVADNLAIAQSNKLINARMAAWKKDILSGKTTFEKVAKEVSQDESSDANVPGSWGDFERGRMESKAVQAVAFSLRQGEISDPVEDEEGVHLLKVRKISPPERDSKGRVICDEVRSLSHIYIEKEPQIIFQTNEAMFKDMEQQMQLQAVDRYVESLRTNGISRVEYPHGEKLFQ